MNAATPLPTVHLADTVYGAGPENADLVELVHEASKLHPTLLPRQLDGAARLLQDQRLLASTGRAVRRNPSLPTVALPQTELPAAELGETIAQRRSTRSFAPAPLTLGCVASILDAAYGITAPADEAFPSRRSVPSAGALYPLELYLIVHRVAGLRPGLYHFDPLLHRLEVHAVDATPPEPDHLFPNGAEAAGAAAIVVVAAVFWRARVKYGLRAYRFTLLEAGHVVQNVLLAATAFRVGNFEVGGFYDARVDDLLGLNGVDESSLVAVFLGEPA